MRYAELFTDIFALVSTIVCEFLGAHEGMGLLIATARRSLDSNRVFAAVIVIAVVALENPLLTWRPCATINE